MSMAAPNASSGSLERLDITVSTEAPEDILTPNAVKAVRFRKSKPWGYLADDVQSFQDIVKSSVSWYIDKLHDRDLDIHRLGKEIDDRENQIAKLNVQLASASYNSNVQEAVNLNQSDKEMADLMARHQTLTADLTASQTELVMARQNLAAAQAELAAAQAQLAALPVDTSAPPVEEPAEDSPSAELVTENEQLRIQLAQAEAYNKQLEDFADEQEAYIGTLLAQLTPAADDTTDLVEDAEGEPGDGEQPLAQEQEDIYAAENEEEEILASDTEEPEEQLYAADAADIDYDDDDEAGDYPTFEDEEEEEVSPLPEPQPVYTPEPASVDGPTPQNPYSGQPLPPGIRPEDL